MPTIEQRDIILDAPRRAYEFMNSATYLDLKADLDNRTASVKKDLQVIIMAQLSRQKFDVFIMN